MTLLNSIDKICYKFYHIIIVFCTFIPAAYVFYIPLPVFLAIKSLIFYFPCNFAIFARFFLDVHPVEEKWQGTLLFPPGCIK